MFFITLVKHSFKGKSAREGVIILVWVMSFHTFGFFVVVVVVVLLLLLL